MKMKFYLLIFVFVLTAMPSLMAQEAEEQESDWSYGVTTGFSNKYLWRGLVYNDGLVFQPEAYVAWKDLSFSLWSNTTLYDVNGENAHEIDYTLDYYHSFEKFDIEAYFSYFQYIKQEDSPNTGEFVFKSFYPVGDFTIFASASFDLIDNVGGEYFEAGLNYEKELSDKFTLTGSLLTAYASSAFNNYYLEVEKGAFNLVGGSVGLSYNLLDFCSIEANCYLNCTIDKALIDAMGKSTNAVEIKLSKEF